MPEISVIVPVYKVEQFLHRCVESILRQSFYNFELILVSCDRNKNAMMEYMKKYDMPFLASPFRDPMTQALMRDLQVRGIPALAIYSADGKLITTAGRNDVMKNGVKAFDNWSAQSK